MFFNAWHQSCRLVLVAMLIAARCVGGMPPAIADCELGFTSLQSPATHHPSPATHHPTPAKRRQGTHIICHRGASEFAHENTLEAYRATFELGGDGNEIDIRITQDGVLVCFHDDMLDRILRAFGDVSDLTWDELQRQQFRSPGRFGDACRIPTLAEVLELHREHGGLLHLDIKRPNLDRAIMEMLDRFDMWDHVVHCNTDHGGRILTDPRLKLGHYKAGLYLDRGEVFPDAIAAVLAKPGDGVIVDDPRGVIHALGRPIGAVSKIPVSIARAVVPAVEPAKISPSEIFAILRDDADWDQVAETPADRERSGARIRTRAHAADAVLRQEISSEEIVAALERRVRHRSLHKDWMYHGLDGAIALCTLIRMRAPRAVETAREVLWRDDPMLDRVVNRQYKNPRAWTDFRVKMVVFPALVAFPSSATESLCRDYLGLSDDAANALGPALFEEAARTLITVSPNTETARELLGHRLQVVRGRAILDCLARVREPWARAALEANAPHALAYIVEP